MAKFLITLILFISSVLQAGYFSITPQEQQWLEKHKTITVRVAPNLAPFQSYVKGEPSGIAVDYIKYVANNLGIKLTFISDYTWEEALERIQTHDGFDVALQRHGDRFESPKNAFLQTLYDLLLCADD